MKNFMMVFVMAVLLTIGGTAFANGNHDKNSHGQHHDQHQTDVDVDVSNRNTNTNMNINTNKAEQDQAQAQLQGQVQGQLQGQLQGQAQDQANVQETNITQIVERDFHNAPEINTPGFMDSKTDTMNWNVQRTGNILWIKSMWSRYHLKKMLNGNSSLKSAKSNVAEWVVDKKDSDEIEIVLDIDKNAVNISLLGTVSVRGNSNDESFDCLFKAALDALDMGANTLLVSGEGVGKVLKGFSWGIGFNVSSAKMSDGDSQVTTGGLGVSSGSSEYKSKPWVQTLALYVYNK